MPAARLVLVAGSTALALLLLEALLRTVAPGAAPVGYARQSHDLIPDRVLGYRSKPASSFHAFKKRLRGNPCYEAVYTTDAFGRRIVGVPNAAPARTPRLVLFGCSYTFGEGLADQETLQFKLGAQFDVINYAVQGHGPQHTLALLRDGRLRQELPENDALGLYVFYPFHMNRALVTSDHAHVIHGPVFELGDDGTLHQYARFSDRNPIRAHIYRLLQGAREHSVLFFRLGIRWPPRRDPGRAPLTAAILTEAAHRFEERWGRFAVAVHGAQADAADVRWVIDRLRAANVAVLDYSTIEIAKQDQIDGGCDSHPNGRFAAGLAARLRSDLGGLALAAPTR